MSQLTYFYPWLKSLHIISVLAWMAGLLYLPRLFVYHCELSPGSEASELFKIMEGRLYRQIIVPAMLAAWFFGSLLVCIPGVINWHSGWWHTKLAAVILLSGITGIFGSWRKAFLLDRNRRSQRFYRVTNEVPTLLMIIIVTMVVAKPF